MQAKTLLVAWLSLVGALDVEAGEWDLTGSADLSSRVFHENGRFAEQESSSATSLAVQPEFYWQGSRERVRFSGVAFGRADAQDDERSHVDIREASFGVAGDGWDLNVGLDKVFWGVTESRHLVDVINQSDLVEDIDEEQKLGQPMVNLNLDREFGRLGLFVLPRFRERTFPGPAGRLRAALPVERDAAIFESKDGIRHTDVSLRYSHYFGSFDIGAYVFDGTSREPTFQLTADRSRLVPVYEQMRQIGFDAQLTRDSWLWKLEAIGRKGSSDRFAAAVAGFEYTFFGARGSAADVGVLLEYLYDGRDASAPPTAFDDDVFVGMRLAPNDVNDSSLLVGAVLDVHTHESFLSVEASRRFGTQLTVEARLRVFSAADPGDATYSLQQDDYLQLTASWHY